MERVHRLSEDEVRTLSFHDIGGAILRVTRPEGTTEITRVPLISLQETANASPDIEPASEDH